MENEGKDWNKNEMVPTGGLSQEPTWKESTTKDENDMLEGILQS
jgi:hypothetical protein